MKGIQFGFVVPEEWVGKIRRSAFDEYIGALRDGSELDLYNIDLNEAYALSEDEDFENCGDCTNFNKLFEFLEESSIDYYDYGYIWTEDDGTKILSVKVYLKGTDFEKFLDSVKAIHGDPDFTDYYDCDWYYVLVRELRELPESGTRNEIIKIVEKLRSENLEPHIIHIIEC